MSFFRGARWKDALQKTRRNTEQRCQLTRPPHEGRAGKNGARRDRRQRRRARRAPEALSRQVLRIGMLVIRVRSAHKVNATRRSSPNLALCRPQSGSRTPTRRRPAGMHTWPRTARLGGSLAVQRPWLEVSSTSPQRQATRSTGTGDAHPAPDACPNPVELAGTQPHPGRARPKRGGIGACRPRSSNMFGQFDKASTKSW